MKHQPRSVHHPRVRLHSRFVALLGVVFAPALIAFVLWDPIRLTAFDVALITAGIQGEALIESSEEEPDTDDTGRTVWFSSVVYSFRTKSGETVYGVERVTRRLRDDLREIDKPMPAVVEYLPGHPWVNRLRSDRQGISILWLSLRVVALLIGVGIWLWFLVHSVVSEIRNPHSATSPSAE